MPHHNQKHRLACFLAALVFDSDAWPHKSVWNIFRNATCGERQGAHCQGTDGLKRLEGGASGLTVIRPLAMEHLPSLFLQLSQSSSLINTHAHKHPVLKWSRESHVCEAKRNA